MITADFLHGHGDDLAGGDVAMIGDQLALTVQALDHFINGARFSLFLVSGVMVPVLKKHADGSPEQVSELGLRKNIDRWLILI
jgi:hypothetical protein